MVEPIVKAEGLRKHYGRLVAVDGISFQVRPGECFGLLGPNGSGKTSTLRMIGCVSPLTGGELWVDGKSVREQPREIRRIIGVVPQEDNLDPDFTVLKNLRVYARYFGIPDAVAVQRAREQLRFFHLEDRENSRVDSLSGGMKRRLLIARAMLHQPKLLILDEPTTGLDPQARHLLWERLMELKAQGITMLLSTHYMDEAAQLCDRLVIMDLGHILAEGSPRELVQRYAGHQVLELRPSPQQRAEVIARLQQMALEFQEGGRALYVFPRDGHDLAGQLAQTVEEVTIRSANLEDVYLRLTGRGLRGEQ